MFDVVELTRHEFDVLVEKAKLWEQHVTTQAEPTPVNPVQTVEDKLYADAAVAFHDLAADRELAEANQEAPAAALSSEG